MADYLNKDVRSRSGLSASQINSYIAGKVSNSEKTYGTTSVMRNSGSAFLEVEATYGINAGFLIAVSALESGWGCSNFAVKNNSLMGVGAYNKNPSNTAKYGGKTVRDGLHRSVDSLKKTFFERYEKWTISKMQQMPKPYAQLDNGQPTPHWAGDVSRIWANVMSDTNTGTPSSESSSSSMVGRNYNWFMYTMIKGDSVASIAKKYAKYGTSAAFIYKWNGVTSGTVLNPGTKLRVYPYYIAKQGDTLNSIATDFGTSISMLKSINPTIATSVSPGQQVALPQSVVTGTPPSSLDVRDAPTSIGGDVKYLSSPEVKGSAPGPEDGEYPKHRWADSPFVMRIGDVQFFLPPAGIQVTKTASVDSRFTMRAKSPTQTKSGYTKQIIELNLGFAGVDQINGYPVAGVGGQTYYMDGLRPLIAQFMKNPFLPIRNELINERYQIFNVALYDISIMTVPDYPNMFNVYLQLIECTQEPFTQYPDYYYDNLIMYPLFRWWYQQMLCTDRTISKSGTYLRPIDKNGMNGNLHFRVLDRDLLEDLMSGEYGTQYALSKLKLTDLSSLMSEWDIGPAVVTGITAKMTKTLTPIQVQDIEIPAFQDLGGTTHEFSIQMTLTSRDQLESLNLMVSHLEEMSRQYRNRFVSGFLEIDNEVLNLMGIYHAMITGLKSKTIEGFDDYYEVTLVGRGFTPTQKNNERIMGVNNMISNVKKYYALGSEIIDTKSQKLHEVVYETKIEEALRLIELYPDLELPTYDDLNYIIPKINANRKSKGYPQLPITKMPDYKGSAFADPDFYFAYPDIQKVWEDMEMGDLGQKIMNLNLYESFNDPATLADEANVADWISGIKSGLVKNWEDEKSVMLSEKSKKVNIDFSKMYKTKPLGSSWDPDTHPAFDPNDFMQDMTMYDKRGRMVRAFPSYLMLFVDEGMWIDGRRLWNNYYTYHAIHDIAVVKDKDNPVDLAYISLSNVYGAFDFSEKLSEMKDAKSAAKTLTQKLGQLVSDFYLTMDEKDIEERTQMLEQARLHQGARVHIRLGYGSAPEGMPVVFNGQIAEINEGEYDVQIVCQGDGVELINQVIEPDPHGGGFPEETRNLFTQVMCTRDNDWLFATTGQNNLFNNRSSKYGIEHFGQVWRKEDDDGFWNWLGESILYPFKEGLFSDKPYVTYDVMKNIYRGNEKPYTKDTARGNPFDGERNVQLNLFGHTAWDSFVAHSLFNPEFICAVHPHGFRSTLFFGLPHWMVKYGYVEKKYSSPYRGENYAEKYKPFQQFHTFASGYDIIGNQIKASSEKIAHGVIGIFAKNGGSSPDTTYTLYADRTIARDQQKIITVDTMVSENLWGWDPLNKGIRWVVAAAYDVLDTVNDIAMDLLGKDGWSLKNSEIRQPGEEDAKIIAIGSLQRKMMEMYQGQLVIFGDPSVKPWDIFYLSDTHTSMSGTAQVGKVTHNLSMRTGFTSIIKPDLCCTRVDGLDRNITIQAAVRIGTLMSTQMIRKLAASKLARNFMRATRKGTVGGLRPLAKGGARLIAGKNISAKLTRLTKRGVVKTLKGIKTTKQALGSLKGAGGALKLMKGAGLPTLLLTEFLSMMIEDWISKEFEYNNCIFIFPLWRYDRPFVAGVKGAQYIMPGYVPPEQQSADHVTSSSSGRQTKSNLPSGTFRGVVAPVDHMRVTSWFGKRKDPTNKSKVSRHNGIDIGSLPGQRLTTPIKSISDGRVDFAGLLGTAGYTVGIIHRIDGTDFYVRYQHMKQGSLKVRAGETVKAGQVIGTMGSTGKSTGVHLHINISKGTKAAKDIDDPNAVDPKEFFARTGVKLTTV
ncbi:peptidoglycan DD-metalloendopeptidase family protein (plasmid) [Paenibacillus sp. EC2-1]|uniref:peptidoglycan DD-metalloendopeptidase family protein n=1 Tax=Paenibacillus sp. EC2-1 TaxID=3388665 RepID=UPI003BEF39C7